MNIRIDYLFRDSGNYKQFGNVVLYNHSAQSPGEILEVAKEHLIDGSYFYAQALGLPPLYGTTYNPESDPTWHEFEGVTAVKDAPDIDLDVSTILTRMLNIRSHRHDVEPAS